MRCHRDTCEHVRPAWRCEGCGGASDQLRVFAAHPFLVRCVACDHAGPPMIEDDRDRCTWQSRTTPRGMPGAHNIEDALCPACGLVGEEVTT